MGWLLLISGILINVSAIVFIKGSQASEQAMLAILGYLAHLIFSILVVAMCSIVLAAFNASLFMHQFYPPNLGRDAPV